MSSRSNKSSPQPEANGDAGSFPFWACGSAIPLLPGFIPTFYDLGFYPSYPYPTMAEATSIPCESQDASGSPHVVHLYITPGESITFQMTDQVKVIQGGFLFDLPLCMMN